MHSGSVSGRAFLIVAAALAALSSSACTTGEDSSVGVLEQTADVGPSGGHLTLAGVELDVPANAVGQATSITVKHNEPKPAGYTVDGSVYRFEPAGLVFSKPVTVTFPASAPAQLVFWTAGGSEDHYEPLVTTIEGGKAIAHPSHFSLGFVGMDQKKPTDACEGAREEACGNCGARTRTCHAGVWSAWTACETEGACTPNTTEACETGTRTCTANCQWDGCKAETTCEGASSEACGNCGTRSRSCNSGVWSEWTACGGEGTCAPSTTEACGTGGTRTCASTCAWGGCSDQTCSGATARACGNCGTQTRTCNGGLWSTWSACSSEGVCAPTATEACGANGARTCSASCAWGVCTGQTCDGPSTQACGNCGSQSRTCANGTWSAWSTCNGAGACSPNTTQACGPGGTQACNASCEWGTCSVPVCDGPATQACGNCGKKTRTCDGGVWSSWSACTDEGVCRPYDVQTCGAGGSQACTTSCQWESCQSWITCTSVERYLDATNVCAYRAPTYGVANAVEHGVNLMMASYNGDYEGGANTTSSGINYVARGFTPVFYNRDASHTKYTGDFGGGVLERDKSTGVVTATVDATRLFSLTGDPPSCPKRIEVKCRGSASFMGCDGPTSQSCGNCGTQTRRCTESGWENIGWSVCSGQGVCSPAATQSCGGGGTSTCTASCQWAGCCTQPTDPARTTLAAAARPLGVAVDACNVYWTDQSGGLRVVSKNGGAATLASAGGPLPKGAVGMRSDALVSDGTNLYWTDRVSSASGGYEHLFEQGAVWQTTLAGNVSTKIWSGSNSPRGLGVTGSNIFIGRASDVLRVATGGGAVSPVCTVGSDVLAATSTDMFLGKYNEVLTVPTNGGTPTVFAPAAGSATVVVTDGTNVYWGDFDGAASVGHLYAKPLAGGAQRTLASGAILPLGIAFDSTHLYVTTGSARTVLKIAIADGATTTLATGEGWPVGIAVDSQFVYWANNDGGTNGIMRVGK